MSKRRTMSSRRKWQITMRMLTQLRRWLLRLLDSSPIQWWKQYCHRSHSPNCSNSAYSWSSHWRLVLHQKTSIVSLLCFWKVQQIKCCFSVEKVWVWVHWQAAKAFLSDKVPMWNLDLKVLTDLEVDQSLWRWRTALIQSTPRIETSTILCTTLCRTTRKWLAMAVVEVLFTLNANTKFDWIFFSTIRSAIWCLESQVW